MWVVVVCCRVACALTYFSIDDTSMISGMSRENPAEERLFLMLHIWSAYDVTGEVTIKTGAMCVSVQRTSDMTLLACQHRPFTYDVA